MGESMDVKKAAHMVVVWVDTTAVRKVGWLVDRKVERSAAD